MAARASGMKCDLRQTFARGGRVRYRGPCSIAITKVSMAKFFRVRRVETRSPDEIDPDRSASLVLGQLTGNKGPAPGVTEDRRRGDDRRGGYWRSFMYGNLRPRRRRSRREVDEHEYLFDWHEPRILYLGLAVLLLSCVDALFTVNLLKGGANEANLIMASLLDRGIDQFLAVKISLTAIPVIILVAAAQRKFLGLFRVVRFLQVICAGYLAVICYELYLFTHVFELKITQSLLMP